MRKAGDFVLFLVSKNIGTTASAEIIGVLELLCISFPLILLQNAAVLFVPFIYKHQYRDNTNK